MKKYFVSIVIILCVLISYGQTLKDDLNTVLSLEKIEDVELLEYIKTRIDGDFINHLTAPTTDAKRLILEYVAHYTDATIVFDSKGWIRLMPQGWKLYECEVYSYNQKLTFCLPSVNDHNAYIAAEKAFNKLCTDKVIKVIINQINTKKVKP